MSPNPDQDASHPHAAGTVAPVVPGFAPDLAGAQRCVLCGMCVPQCPTYAVRRMEGDSPRGRITLMLGLAQGRLEPGNGRLRAHLEGCLGCRSCEAICPAGVRFGALMDTSRQILREHPGGTARGGLPERLFAPGRRLALRRPTVRRLGALAARTARGVGLQRLFPASTRIGRLLRHAGPSLVRMPALRIGANAEAEVLLFTGCMDAFFTGPDIAAALELLEELGIRAALPPGQVCCGAIDQHLGRPGAAAALRLQNERIFAGGQPIVVLDSGCEAQWREYPGDAWRERVTSLTGFLARLPADDSRWREDPVRVALHLPCTLRNVNRETEGIRRLFGRLPGVQVTALVPPHNCCGAGGTAMLTQPEMADTLGHETLEALQAGSPDVIVSPNVGCSVHLRALQQRGKGGPRIVSPARFLRERLAGPAGSR
jgi:glycolate oxidase iron-sulfur subunit